MNTRPEIQILERERAQLRLCNDSAEFGFSLLFSEAAVTLILLERCLRLAVGVRGQGKTLRTLLLQATDKKSGFLFLHGAERAIKVVADVRNAIMHGDFESAIPSASELSDYIANGLRRDLALLHEVTDSFLKQLQEMPEQI